MKNKFFKVLSAFKVKFNNINAMAAVKGGRPLIRIITMLLPAIGLQTTSARVRCIVVFLRKVHKLYRNNGAKGLCLTLKVYAVVLQQSIGGHVVRDITELKFRVARTNRGLPRIIPVQHREMIRKGDTEMMRFYLTLFNLYRVIEFKGDMRLSSLSKTIVSPAKTLIGFSMLQRELYNFIPIFWNLLKGQIGLSTGSLKWLMFQEYESAKAEPLLKSSPFTAALHKFEDLSKGEQEEAMAVNAVVSTHPLAVHEAANALENNAELYEDVHYFLGLLPEKAQLRSVWRQCVSIPLVKGMGTQKAFNPTCGKLALKQEAAGKIRVFAMVDCWTQWLLKPLHSTIFDHILPGIPQDGTKDQLAPVHLLLKGDPNSLMSLDLSAATDRLPLWLQVKLLSAMTGEIFAKHWASFLVNRDYVLTLTDNNTDLPVRYKLRYAVGQPMGAYSS